MTNPRDVSGRFPHGDAPPVPASIGDDDTPGPTEVSHGQENDGLDLIRHGQDGSPDATKAMASCQ
ncbi:MAG: hypothetical protein OXF88_10140 [Rhodobacteraceae bacterium]|nr:hypothetical protein [Paracoccaceae bacterium]